MLTEILCGDNLPILREMPDNSVDAIVTDPPYGLSFMGKRWDYDVPSVELWAECLRVLKPGGHLLAFAGTRTQHRMAVRIEDAGFEIRDMIAWVYGSGFPKSLDIGKAVKEWDGWGTALKPALEPITLARKPLAERTVAANVLEWGTGGVNVDGCRVGTDTVKVVGPADGGRKFARKYDYNGANLPNVTLSEHNGRFPANLIHDGSNEVVGLFPVQPSGKNDGKMVSAARFFYCAKASRSEREAGLEGVEKQNNMRVNAPRENEEAKHNNQLANHHPTVKPIALMRYLCRLVTPPNGVVLDPFTGSGTTGCAATLEGFGFIGIEREAEYAEIARRRIEHWRDVASQDEAIIEDVQEKLFAEMV